MNSNLNKEVIVIGGGLAGVEAANQITKFGIEVTLYEMRPNKLTPAHKTSNLAELVCSNSLKSNSLDNASGILKQEMRILRSLVIEAADKSSVPAGKALAVDRINFSEYITNSLEKNPYVKIIRKEFKKLPIKPDIPIIIASGPLTSGSLSKQIFKLTDSSNLYFYDSISPILDAESLDNSKMFRASRHEINDSEEGDYLNCPLTKDQYYRLVDEIIDGEKIEMHEFENPIYFESCMPVEIICDRGKDTLRFGPLKPVGLKNPKTGKIPFAVLQLRTENKEETMYNMVGFQTKLKYSEQKRIFSKISGLERAEFLRYGSIHRNTYINSPKLLNQNLQLKDNNMIFFAGQITGVEGYVESAATGIIAGINASRILLGKNLLIAPQETAIGSLIQYITNCSKKNFQPMNINFGLFPNIEGKTTKILKRKLIAERALEKISSIDSIN